MAEENQEQVPEGCTHDCSSCAFGNCGARTAPQKYEVLPSSHIKKIIAVVSGKGGVGKSAVTCLLASELTKQGKKVGILDADITGPSIPKAFGVNRRPGASIAGIEPILTESGIKIMSLNLLLDNEEAPVAWRGPLIGGVIKQFYEEVMWGELDYLLFDMPPGTSDVFLTIMQMIPVDGIVTVSAPQELVQMIVGKAVNLAKEMNVPVTGLVENMSYFVCDECDKKHYIFGETQAKDVAEKYDIPSYATLPLDPKFARLVDAGKVEEYEIDGALNNVIEHI
ncbi:MAG: Mrp/NBP35 family ATP-binding protein [Phoenicibacter congonensis]|uniref:Iron-sulfur cluster carrier protein n=1 Tax=Phoenicibacter congonensis TaxID=1944646 RepID=A0AA43RHB3_9ACTN|nr:Mrp/NBP35 family ATP-binding protein [Phoenicibacter congonensis]